MTDDAALLPPLRLHLTKGLGPLAARRLLDRFGDPEGVLAARPEEWMTVPGVGPKLTAALAEARRSDAAERELARCRRENVRVLTLGGDGYPEDLANTPDPPLVLYCRGETLERDRLAVGIVGSRSGTLYGRQMAERFARELARAGVTVVSGLARGIDAAAHKGALEAGGRTLAVIAPGLANLYPPDHVDLAREIVAAGAVLSESPLDRKPAAGLFPQRNRIIAGLSTGVLIVEAARNSGALHTARHAQEQNREVFVLPGRITDPSAAGCLDLIREGATLVRGTEDVLEALGPLASSVTLAAEDGGGTVNSVRELALSELERSVLQHVPEDPCPQDSVLAACGLPAHQALSTITVLEMRRFVRRLPGGQIVRVPA